MFRQLRCRTGMPKNSKQAKTALPPAYHGVERREEKDDVQELEEPTVAMVSVAVPAPAPVIVTGVPPSVEPPAGLIPPEEIVGGAR